MEFYSCTTDTSIARFEISFLFPLPNEPTITTKQSNRPVELPAWDYIEWSL